MKVQFQKNKESKNVIRFLRTDASSTWTKGDNFLVLHDLSHYTIETTLNYTTAFYGIIKSGVSIQNFEVYLYKRHSLFLLIILLH